jgi:REP element-mobilizing transposase RayT
VKLEPSSRGQECPRYTFMFRTRTYQYRRRLPHYQKFDRALFVTFCKLSHDAFCDRARDLVLQHCIHEHRKRIDLHAVVVMPDHVHLLFTALTDTEGWPYPTQKILKMIKGTSARDINRALGSGGPVWQDESFDHVLRSQESLEEKIEYVRMNPVRAGLVQKPEDYKWLWTCGAGIV